VHSVTGVTVFFPAFILLLFVIIMVLTFDYVML